MFYSVSFNLYDFFTMDLILKREDRVKNKGKITLLQGISHNSYSGSCCFSSSGGFIKQTSLHKKKAIPFENASYVNIHIFWYNKNKLDICLTCLFKKEEMCKEIESIHKIWGENGRKTKMELLSAHFFSEMFLILSYSAEKRSHFPGLLLQITWFWEEFFLFLFRLLLSPPSFLPFPRFLCSPLPNVALVDPLSKCHWLSRACGGCARHVGQCNTGVVLSWRNLDTSEQKTLNKSLQLIKFSISLKK